MRLAVGNNNPQFARHPQTKTTRAVNDNKKKKNYRSANEQIRRRSRKYYDAQRTDKLVILVTISIHTTKILEEKNLKHKNITRRNA